MRLVHTAWCWRYDFPAWRRSCLLKQTTVSHWRVSLLSEFCLLIHCLYLSSQPLDSALTVLSFKLPTHCFAALWRRLSPTPTLVSCKSIATTCCVSSYSQSILAATSYWTGVSSSSVLGERLLLDVVTRPTWPLEFAVRNAYWFTSRLPVSFG